MGDSGRRPGSAVPTTPIYEHDEVRQVMQMKIHHARVGLYTTQVAAREEAALAAVRDLDSTHHSSTETTHKIQGDRPGDPAGDVAGSGGTPPPRAGRTLASGPDHHGARLHDAPGSSPTNPPTNATADIPASDDPLSLGPPASAGHLGGVVGAVGGGLARVATGLLGALRDGGPHATASGPSVTAPAIGSQPRTRSVGATCRGAAVAAGPTAGRGAGVGGTGGRAGRRTPRETTSQVDTLVDDHDWVEDEDAGPASSADRKGVNRPGVARSGPVRAPRPFGAAHRVGGEVR